MTFTLDGYCPACGESTLAADEYSTLRSITCQSPGCPAPDTLAQLLAKPDQHVHLIDFREDGYTCQHPLAERVKPESLFACTLADDFRALDGPPGIGMYRVPPGGSLADAEPVERDSVLFEVPAAPPSPEVDDEERREGLASLYPLGSITGLPRDRQPPEGWVMMTDERQAVPEDCTELLDFIAWRNDGSTPEEPWPFLLDDGTPAVPSAREFGGAPHPNVGLAIRVK